MKALFPLHFSFLFLLATAAVAGPRSHSKHAGTLREPRERANPRYELVEGVLTKPDGTAQAGASVTDPVSHFRTTTDGEGYFQLRLRWQPTPHTVEVQLAGEPYHTFIMQLSAPSKVQESSPEPSTDAMLATNDLHVTVPSIH